MTMSESKHKTRTDDGADATGSPKRNGERGRAAATTAEAPRRPAQGRARASPLASSGPEAPHQLAQGPTRQGARPWASTGVVGAGFWPRRGQGRHVRRRGARRGRGHVRGKGRASSGPGSGLACRVGQRGARRSRGRGRGQARALLGPGSNLASGLVGARGAASASGRTRGEVGSAAVGKRGRRWGRALASPLASSASAGTRQGVRLWASVGVVGAGLVDAAPAVSRRGKLRSACRLTRPEAGAASISG